MAAKLLFFVVATFLAFQGGKTTEQQLESPFSQLIEIVKNALLTVNKLISQVIDAAKFKINDLITSLREIRKMASELATDTVKREMITFNNLLDELKKKANKPAYIIIQCIEDTENEAAQIEEKAINQSIVCIDSVLVSFLNTTIEIADGLENINIDFADEEEQLDKCEDKIVPIDCIKDVISGMLNIAATVPSIVKDDVSKVVNDFRNVELTVVQCSRDVAANLKEDTYKVFNDFSQCVYDHAITTESTD